MSHFRKIVGDRLYFSPFDPEDPEICAKWAEWMNDKDVAEYYGGYFNVVSQTSAKKTLAELKGYRFNIMLQENDELIGHISLHDVDHLHRNAFMGICIGKREHRGRGYGTEAVRMVLDYGFNTLNLHNISLSVHGNNAAAIACYKKVGFQEAGRRREWIFTDGTYMDRLYMDILEREFTGREPHGGQA